MTKKIKPNPEVTQRLKDIHELLIDLVSEIENSTHPRAIRMLRILKPLVVVLPMLIKLSEFINKEPKA